MSKTLIVSLHHLCCLGVLTENRSMLTQWEKHPQKCIVEKVSSILDLRDLSCSSLHLHSALVGHTNRLFSDTDELKFINNRFLII